MIIPTLRATVSVSHTQQIPTDYQARRFTRLSRGWTLPELLAACAIMVILATMAVPGFHQWQRKSAETAALSTLGHAADFARLHAIRDHQYTTVCASVDGSRCDGQWQHRIAVFSDHNHNETLDGNDRLLRLFDQPDAVPCIHWQASASRDYLQFKPNGSSNGTAGHFRLCDPIPGQRGRKLVVSLNGRTALRNQ